MLYTLRALPPIACGVVLSFSILAAPARADQALSGDALRDTVAGRTMVVDTPVGGLPIRYQVNGTMTGQSKAIAQFTGTARDSGTWWVSSNKLCQRWDNWLDGKQHCMTIRKDGHTSLQWESNDGRSGTATVS